MKNLVLLIITLMGLSLSVNSQNQQVNSITGTLIKASVFEGSGTAVFIDDLGKERSFEIKVDYKINGKDFIKNDPTLVDPNKPGFSGDDAYIANPEFVNKKFKVSYKLVNVTQDEKDRGMENYEQVVKLEQIP